jgi:hypothetical protein
MNITIHIPFQSHNNNIIHALKGNIKPQPKQMGMDENLEFPTLCLHKGNFKPRPKQMAMDENLTLPTLHPNKGNFKPQPKQMAMDEKLCYLLCIYTSSILSHNPSK